jgi:hypothetical protein
MFNAENWKGKLIKLVIHHHYISTLVSLPDVFSYHCVSKQNYNTEPFPVPM